MKKSPTVEKINRSQTIKGKFRQMKERRTSERNKQYGERRNLDDIEESNVNPSLNQNLNYDSHIGLNLYFAFERKFERKCQKFGNLKDNLKERKKETEKE